MKLGNDNDHTKLARFKSWRHTFWRVQSTPSATLKVLTPDSLPQIWVKSIVWFAVGLFLFVVITSIQVNEAGVDFVTFYDAGRAVLHGVSPYTVHGYYSPIHVAILSAPLSIFPLGVAYKVYVAVSVASWLWIASKMTSDKVTRLFLIFSPLVWLSMGCGNIEFLPLMALYTNPVIGAALALAKPQMGIILIALIIYRTKSLYPVLVVSGIMVVSYVLGMRVPDLTHETWNLSIFPIGVPVAIALTVYAMKHKDSLSALASGVLMSTYVGPMSWVALAPLASPKRRAAFVFWAISWVIAAWWGTR